MKNKLKLLVILFAWAVAGCESIKVPNVEACVNVLYGGFCKYTVTGKERTLNHDELADFIDEGVAILSIDDFAEIIKLMEKVCNRQPECEFYDDGAPKITVASLKKLQRIRAYEGTDIFPD